MDELMLESSLTNSVLYQSYNSNSELIKIIVAAVQNSIILDEEYVAEQIMLMERTKLSPFVDNVIDAYRKGDIVLVYSKSKKVPQMVPYFIMKTDNNKLKAYIFTNHYGTISKNNRDSAKHYLNITMQVLYALMEGAYVSLYYTKHPTNITHNLGLMRLTAEIYTSMLLRILNREYALSNNPALYAKVSFCISRFYLERIWESTNESVILTYSRNIIGSNNVNPIELNSVSALYDDANIKNISDLIVFLEGLDGRLKGLNLKYFTQHYINMYKAPALFGMEVLPYFLFTIQSALLGSFIVNQPILSDITKNVKGMNKFYPELVKAIM